MELITVDVEKCIKCGKCVNICLSSTLKMGADFPEVASGDSCYSCGHCVAVCPKDALDHVKAPLKNQKSINNKPISKEDAEQFLRTRRSIRNYKEESVPRQLLQELISVARFAPSAINSQGLSYLVVDDKAVLKQAIEHNIEWLVKSPIGKRYENLSKRFHEDGIDGILRGAPSIVVATAKKSNNFGRENAVFSLAYLELFATTLGLGSCWAGIMEAYAKSENCKLQELFGIKDDEFIAGIVMVGYPIYKFKKLVDRNPVNIRFL